MMRKGQMWGIFPGLALAAGPLSAQDLTDDQRAACRAAGGEPGHMMAGMEICLMPTPDGGQPCDRATDCQGLCLADSNTCSATMPPLGCHDVLAPAGRRGTICFE